VQIIVMGVLQTVILIRLGRDRPAVN